MLPLFSRIVDKLSNFLAARKGLLPIMGIFLVAANFLIGMLTSGWWAANDLLLHLGVIVAILGFLLAWAL